MTENTFRNDSENNSIVDIVKKTIHDRRLQIIVGFCLQAIALFLLIAFVFHLLYGKFDQNAIELILNEGISKIKSIYVQNKLGILGAMSAYYFIFKWFGISALCCPIFIYLLGHKIVYKKTPISLFKAFNICILIILWFNLLFTSINNFSKNSNTIEFLPGGLGYEISDILRGLIGNGGILIIVILIFIVFFVYVWDITHIKLNDFSNLKNKITKFFKKKDDKPEEAKFYSKENPEVIDFDLSQNYQSGKKEEMIKDDIELTIEKPQTKDDFKVISTSKSILKTENFDPTLDLSRYKYPTIDILKEHNFGRRKVSNDELEQNKNRIIETLTNFKIGISSIKATIGPTVTLYEIIPDAGVKISRIKNLEDDIALNLAALGIRIIAPIPGRGTIGIEVPNKQREVVPFKSVVESDKFLQSKMELPIIIGKTISNEIYIADLAQMPHLLIAGATGQGKSVGLNVVLASLLYKKHPSQLKLVLVDPKKVELSLFSKIERHFLAKLPSNEESIITVTKEVVHTLNSLCIEMDTRYELLKDAGARNIREYNNKFIKRKLNPNQGHRFLPYIVLVIDEFADMMMTAGKEVETPIARLAQLARAIGIHLVLATQRPSVNVITGIIKANFPVRISYKVSSKIDSRTILDAGGADQLVGKGDLLLSMNSEVIRLQCPYIDTEEIENICEYVGSQQGYQSAYLLPAYEVEKEKTDAADISERDSMFEEAARLVVSHQQGSTSLIQRRLKLGYNRAGRLIDQLEAAGIVGPFEGSKARAVLIPDESSLNFLLE